MNGGRKSTDDGEWHSKSSYALTMTCDKFDIHDFCFKMLKWEMAFVLGV